MPRGGKREGSGRKKLENEDSKSVFVRLPLSLYDELQRKAENDGLNISEYLRRIIKEDLMTIKEIEDMSKESVYEALEDYINSCYRVGKFDKEENIDFFMKENNLAQTERSEISSLYDEIERT